MKQHEPQVLRLRESPAQEGLCSCWAAEQQSTRLPYSEEVIATLCTVQWAMLDVLAADGECCCCLADPAARMKAFLV
jgi:hypothetical protein